MGFIIYHGYPEFKIILTHLLMEVVVVINFFTSRYPQKAK